MICNGGHGTVARAMASGCAVLVVPDDGDQRENALRVAYSGAGLRLPRRWTSAQSLRLAVRRLIADDRYMARAREIAAWNVSNPGNGERPSSSSSSSPANSPHRPRSSPGARPLGSSLQLRRSEVPGPVVARGVGLGVLTAESKQPVDLAKQPAPENDGHHRAGRTQPIGRVATAASVPIAVSAATATITTSRPMSGSWVGSMGLANLAPSLPRPALGAKDAREQARSDGFRTS